MAVRKARALVEAGNTQGCSDGASAGAEDGTGANTNTCCQIGAVKARLNGSIQVVSFLCSVPHDH